MSDTVEVTEFAPEEVALRDALRSVIDPELDLNVVELGLIRKLNIQPDLTEITMIMTTPFCPYGPALLEQARRAAEKHSQKPVKITLGMEMWEPSMMEGGPPPEWGLY
jgi:metal-sulfur cluster biosynthetic enzyme